MTSTGKRGKCQVCLVDVAINGDESVRVHGSPECSGSGLLPQSSPRVQRPCPQPSKSRFATENGAQAAANRRPAVMGTFLRPYECMCGWWHLTHLGMSQTSGIELRPRY